MNTLGTQALLDSYSIQRKAGEIGGKKSVSWEIFYTLE
jgi:aspartate carbamoyltransferase catalytic subunit